MTSRSGATSPSFAPLSFPAPSDKPNEASVESAPLLAVNSEEPDQNAEPRSSYGDVSAFSVVVNCIIGTGVFALPYSVYSAGVPLTLLTFLVCSLFILAAAMWVLEILARTQGRVTADERKIGHDHTMNQMTYRKFGFVAFSEIFAKTAGKWATQIVMVLYCLGCLWAYVAVFASTLAKVIYMFFVKDGTVCDVYAPGGLVLWSSCHLTYLACIFGFGVAVLVLEIFDIAKLSWLHNFFTGYRFFAFIVMLITCIVSLCVDGPASWGKGAPGPGEFKWSGFAVLFTSSAVALNVHYNLPDAIQPMRNKNHAHYVTISAMTLSLAFFLAIGVVCALTFGDSTKGLITLNWDTYTGNGGGWGTGETKWWAFVIQLIIILFPMFNMLSIFPLIATTVGSNVETFISPKIRDAHPRFVTIMCRWANTILPLVLTVFVGKLDVIFQFTGLFAYVLELIIPCLFQILTIRSMGKESGTPYTGFYSSKWLALATLVFGAFAFLFALGEEIWSLAQPAAH